MSSRYPKMAALFAGVAALAAVNTTSALAQTYPNHPIKIVIGFGPGSAADILARKCGQTAVNTTQLLDHLFTVLRSPEILEES